MRALFAIAMLGLGACGAATAPRPADLDGALAGWAERDRADRASSVALHRSALAIGASVRIAHRRPPPIPSGPRVDASFEGAPLASALRLLADAAGLGLVVGDGVEGDVSLDLRGVRPLVAMQALAQAHGIDLEIVGRTVIARRRL